MNIIEIGKSSQLPPKEVVLRTRKFHETGFVVYKGPSRINGDSIVAILTLNSQNRKTGDMAQLWVLSANASPLDAAKTGEDRSVCGECKLRHYMNGACYVIIGQEPQTVWKAWKNGAYPNLPIMYFDQLAGLSIRMCAYGDPLALPIEIIYKLYQYSSNHTSYTHQWKYPESTALQQLCMASVDSAKEYNEAVKLNWRTYRVTSPGEELLPGEIWCPYPETKLQCKDCNLCSGGLLSAKNIAVPVHGTRSKYFHAHKYSGKENSYQKKHERSSRRVVTSRQLMEMEFNEYVFTGSWQEFIGNPSTNFHCVIHGLPGNGKSTFAILFSKYLADNFGKVMYIAAEESISKTIKDKFKSQNAISDNIHIAEYKTANEIIGMMPKDIYDFIFIDSLDNMRIGAEKLRELRSLQNKAAFITISQSTKAGQMRGSAEILHDADFVVILEDGMAKTEKNRFNFKHRIMEILTNES